MMLSRREKRMIHDPGNRCLRFNPYHYFCLGTPRRLRLFAIGNGPSLGKSFEADGSVVDFS